MNKISFDKIHGFVISYTEDILKNVEYPFVPLDNTENPRPDWQEYWPIRKFLLEEKMVDDHYYGFFSPRFQEKTGLSSSDIINYVIDQDNSNDIITFSPQPDMGAFFINIFQQNEIFDPGFLNSSQAFFNFAEIDINISKLVMDSRNIIFSNYFFAKPNFWKRWLNVCEILFSACENYPRIAEIHGWLQSTNYPRGIQRKVFLIERIASAIIIIDGIYKIKSHSPFFFAYSSSGLNRHPDKAIICDALKMAFSETNDHLYLNRFHAIIAQLFE